MFFPVVKELKSIFLTPTPPPTTTSTILIPHQVRIWEFLFQLTFMYDPERIVPSILKNFKKVFTWRKSNLYFVYIFIVDWNFLIKFCSSDPSFIGNILTSIYLKFKIYAHAQVCHYSFIHTIYKFHGMVLAGNSHWGYLLINGVYR